MSTWTSSHIRSTDRKIVLSFFFFIGLMLLILVDSARLNCTEDKRICRQACNENSRTPYSATYCDATTGNCVCDCRDRVNSKCTFTPFTPCYNFCVNLNPNPEMYLYLGGICPVILNHRNRTFTVNEQCVCQCSLREEGAGNSI